MKSSPVKFSRSKMVVGILAVLLAGFSPDGAIAQETGESGKPLKTTLELRETEITAKLRDVLGAFKLSETKVVGTVEKPRLGTSMPWKDPDPFMMEEGPSKFRFLEDVYAPLDKDRHTRRIKSELLRLESLIMKEAK